MNTAVSTSGPAFIQQLTDSVHIAGWRSVAEELLGVLCRWQMLTHTNVFLAFSFAEVASDARGTSFSMFLFPASNSLECVESTACGPWFEQSPMRKWWGIKDTNMLAHPGRAKDRYIASLKTLAAVLNLFVKHILCCFISMLLTFNKLSSSLRCLSFVSDWWIA